MFLFILWMFIALRCDFNWREIHSFSCSFVRSFIRINVYKVLRFTTLVHTYERTEYGDAYAHSIKTYTAHTMLGNECCFEMLKFRFEWTLIQIDATISFDKRKNSNFHEIVIIFIERVYLRRAHKSLSTKSAMREYLMHITARKRQTKYNFIDPFRSGEPERRIE